jgi:hypothetical protein
MKLYKVSVIVLAEEEVTEREISRRIEWPDFEPIIVVDDCHVEEEHL